MCVACVCECISIVGRNTLLQYFANIGVACLIVRNPLSLCPQSSSFLLTELTLPIVRRKQALTKNETIVFGGWQGRVTMGQ